MRLAIFFVLGLTTSPGFAETPTSKSASLLKLARARIEAAEKRSQRLLAGYKAGRTPLAEVLESRALCFAAIRDSPIRGPERVKAAEEYLASVNQMRQLVEARVKMGAAGEDEMATVEYRVAEAQYWLEEARP